MTTIFLSGSRKISQLDEAVTRRLSTIVEKEFHVIVGDANGADKAMAGEADYGLVLWDGESPGSISNVIEMLMRNRRPGNDA